MRFVLSWRSIKSLRIDAEGVRIDLALQSNDELSKKMQRMSEDEQSGQDSAFERIGSTSGSGFSRSVGQGEGREHVLYADRSGRSIDIKI